jgi:y4mF family transcriptional regulator
MEKRGIFTVQEVAEAVRAKRLKEGLTQGEVAAFLGLGRRFVVELEQGKPTVQLAKVLQVINGLGLELVLRSQRGDRS